MTERAIGPAVSWLCESGMMPVRLTSPTVGLTPTRPFTDDGHTTEPSVSVPTPTAARLAAMAAPVPEDEPHGERSSAYGFFVCPPSPLQPEDERVERKLAHSLRFVLPRITAPASRSCRTSGASAAGDVPGERERAGRGGHGAGGFDVVLQQHGDAVERAAHGSGRALGVHPVGGGERAGVDGEHGPERRPAPVHSVDALEVGRGDLAARAHARGHVGLELAHGALGDDARARLGAGRLGSGGAGRECGGGQEKE